MSFTPEQSAIRMTRQLEEEIASASPEQLKAILGRAAYEQGLVVPDAMNPQLLHATALADHAPKRFAKTITVDNQKHILEAESPEALLDAESEFLRQALEQGDNGQPRDAQGRFVHEQTPEEKAAGELQAANRADLELAWKRGDITAEQYLEKSGAINTYLTEHGVSPDALVAVTDLVTQNTWAACTEEFLNSEEGASWPGGEQNMRMLAALMEENNMTEPNVENIVAAYNYARENDLLVSNPETEAHNAISEANSVEDIRQALNRPTQSSGMFNYR